MSINYDKLWKLLRDNKMKKRDLMQAAEIHPHSIRMLNNNKPVNMNVLMNICKVFHCNIGDIVDFVEDEDLEVDE